MIRKSQKEYWEEECVVLNMGVRAASITGRYLSKDLKVVGKHMLKSVWRAPQVKEKASAGTLRREWRQHREGG